METLNIKQKANLEAAKRLVRQYRAITLKTLIEVQSRLKENPYKNLPKDCEEYPDVLIDGHDVLQEILGFGTNYSCKLCVSVGNDSVDINYFEKLINCRFCVWAQTNIGAEISDYLCIGNRYQEIAHEIKMENLITLIRDRANLIENIIKTMEN